MLKETESIAKVPSCVSNESWIDPLRSAVNEMDKSSSLANCTKSPMNLSGPLSLILSKSIVALADGSIVKVITSEARSKRVSTSISSP
ncbi:MAG: hypothetical protein ACXQS8_04280, partial [Candidatus Helarchaeales archaeon]